MGVEPGIRGDAPESPLISLADLRKLLIGRDDARPPTRLRRGRRVLDRLMGFATLAVFLIANTGIDGRPQELYWIVDLLIALPVALLRRYPLLAWRIGWLAAMLLPVAFSANRSQPWPWTPIEIIVFPFLLYGVASRHRRGVVIWAGVLMCVPLGVYVPATEIVPMLVTVAVVLALGDQVRRRREAQRELAVEEGRTELEQARRAVLEERTRIAREMHDVVAHHMSLIAVRAESAGYRIEDLPESAGGEFAGIADAARQALGEMRRLLGVLRGAETDPQRSPQPGLGDLDELVRRARDAGVEVTLTWTGTTADAPAAVGLSAYRIVQEALSNATRHAPGAAVTVDLAVRAARTGRSLAIRVSNGPGGVPSVTATSARHGLVGMRERVAMLGGEFEAGPKPGGGFTLRADLPLDAVSMT